MIHRKSSYTSISAHIHTDDYSEILGHPAASVKHPQESFASPKFYRKYTAAEAWTEYVFLALQPFLLVESVVSRRSLE